MQESDKTIILMLKEINKNKTKQNKTIVKFERDVFPLPTSTSSVLLSVGSDKTIWLIWPI